MGGTVERGASWANIVGLAVRIGPNPRERTAKDDRDDSSDKDVPPHPLARHACRLGRCIRALIASLRVATLGVKQGASARVSRWAHTGTPSRECAGTRASRDRRRPRSHAGLSSRHFPHHPARVGLRS
jgi:hypothetical protein